MATSQDHHIMPMQTTGPNPVIHALGRLYGSFVGSFLIGAVAIAALLGLWQWLAVWFEVPTWLVPKPSDFLGRLVADWQTISYHAGATSLTIQRKGQRQTVHASQEIILSAGTVNSPHLLMLSGIGPADELQKHGIDVVADLPGVGQNLQDHPAVGIAFEDISGKTLALSWKTLPKLAVQALRYTFTRTGVFASNVAEVGGFLRTKAGLNRPDVQVTCLMGLKTAASFIPRQHGFVALINICRPESRGRIELKSASPKDRPTLIANFLDNQNDVNTLVRGLREIRKIMRKPAMAAYSGKELVPGEDVDSDEALEAYVRETVATVYHPVGTCKMGPATDPLAVVDDRLRLRGIEGLRVADASIMPSIVAGNTSAPAMMIGERAAAFILEERDATRQAA